jgi:type II secretory pathway pseudopilin PulG
VAAKRSGAAPSAGQRGFTYLGLIFAVAVLGITLATVGVVWSTQIRREKEMGLLFAGDQIRAAIGRYRMAGGVYPQELADLVDDKRSPVPRRFLRRIYLDPMTNTTDWELVMAPEGGIMGVVSRSKDNPIKVANFSISDAAFEKAECYCEWKFVYTPRFGRRRRVNQPLSPVPLPQT